MTRYAVLAGLVCASSAVLAKAFSPLALTFDFWLSSNEHVPSTFRTVGLMSLLFTMAVFITNSLWFVYATYFRVPLNLEERYGKGSWVVVTGAAGGIGSAFCLELARNYKLNLVLIDINQAALEQLEKEISAENANIKTCCIVKDLFSLGTSTEAYIDLMAEITEGRECALFANIAGIASDGYTTTIASEKCMLVATLNVLPIVMFSRLFLEYCSARAAKGERSGIINIASVFGTMPVPCCSVYSGSKAFVDMFTRSVVAESPAMVDVLSVRPLGVSTRMVFDHSADGVIYVTPDECVKGFLRDLGHDAFSWGATAHKQSQVVLALLQAVLPERLVQYAIANLILREGAIARTKGM